MGDSRVESAGPDVRLVPPAVAAWSAAWWATGARVSWVITAGVGLALTGVLALGRRDGPAQLRLTVALACAACVAVLATTAVTASVRGAGPFPRWAVDRAVVELTGQLVSDPRRVAPGPWGGPPRYAVRVDAGEASARGQRAVVHAPVLVLGDQAWARLSAGSRVVVSGRLSPPQPGDDVAALITAFGGPRRADPGQWWWRAADRVRAGLRTAVTGLPQDAGGLLPSLVVGDTSTLTPSAEASLRTAGLTHLTAVSGANVAIVIGGILWLAAAAGVRRPARVAVAVAGLLGFVILARPEPSVLRAAVMGAVGLAGLSAGRRARGVPALATAIIVLVVADPWLARSAGFALSSVATGALLLLAPPWAARLERWMPRPAALALAAPAAAQAVCGPVVVLLNPTVSFVAVPANLFAEPAVAPATLLGVLAALLSLGWPSGAHAVAWIACVATGWITLVAQHAAQLPGAALPWVPGLAGAVALALLTGLVVLGSLAVRRPARGTVGSRSTAVGSARPVAAVAVGAALALVSGWLLAPQVIARLPPGLGGSRWPGPGWSIVMCDVGQGDALVVRSGVDHAVLVDAGPDPAPIDGCLRRLGVRQLDLVVLTHFHADHVLGLPGALDHRPATRLLVSPLAEPPENADAVRRWAAEAGVPVTVGWAGAGAELGSDGWVVRWRALLPDATTVPSTAPGTSTPGSPGMGDDGMGDGSVVNGSSIATVFDVQTPDGERLRLVGLGDLEVPGQQRLAALIAAVGPTLIGGPVDIVKVAHHGSAKQDPELYRLLAPRVGVIGVGAGNDYGHPAASALQLFERLGIAAHRTDREGDIAVTTGAGHMLAVGTSR